LAYGSVEAVVQESKIDPPLKTFVGVLRVRAETKGATSTRRLHKIVSFFKKDINTEKM
jgi:hypothetical protein